MKRGMGILVALFKLASAQPTGEIIEIPVVRPIEEILKSYSMFVGTVLSILVILFIVLLIRIYKKRKRQKKSRAKRK
ncbi:MAG: hypothetical protein QXO84_03575 [Candidatus Aenigmatarchaeota archaeon]